MPSRPLLCGFRLWDPSGWREVAAKVGMAHLNYLLETFTVQHMCAQIQQPGTVGKISMHRLLGRTGYHRLTAVGKVAKCYGVAHPSLSNLCETLK